MQVVAVQGCATGVPVPSGTGAQRLGEVQSDVNSVAHLLDGAFRQQVDMLIVRVVMILGRLGERRARPLGQSYPRLRNVFDKALWHFGNKACNNISRDFTRNGRDG